MLGRLSLRARLVLGVILLAAVGLAAANVVTYTSLRSFLLDRTDQSLRESRVAIVQELFLRGCPEGGPALRGLSPRTYIELRGADGEVLCTAQAVPFAEEAPSPPDLPEEVTAPAAAPDPDSGSFFTADAVDGGERYRVQGSSLPRTGQILLVAAPLTDLDETLGRLVVIEFVVTALVLAGLALLGLWVVRLGLRPLSAIGATAAAIAEGELSKRVERAEPRTEVGRLGLALNAMLGQIEAAFRAQTVSEQRLRRFVADASHELRTPLAAVRAYAELFGRGAAQRPEDLERSMKGITREAERMSLLVDDLLLLARLDEGRPLERRRVELDRIVADAVETARTVEPAREIELASEPVGVTGDAHRLRQIVDNLLANVRAHTPPRTPVSLRVWRDDGRAVVEISDSGPGIAAADLERVFERFYLADKSRSRAHGGVGLGLSIVAAVAEAHGGLATAHSRPGEGATFRVVLPLAPRSGTPEQFPFQDPQRNHRGFLATRASMGRP
ncbi:MAG TPA: HAMP domain-containing sensor histidine kinase [Gaiellaceae bacterium]|nr:HAMP domain-containing sensor histidine kinase [Gaiellaceae bacterium]